MGNTDLNVENKAIAVQQEKQKNGQNPLFSFFNNLHLNFPQFNKQQSKQVSPMKSAKVETKSPDFVKLEDSRKEYPSLKLEGEDFEDATSGSGPQNMWQVYALGGFMIGRWLWARWCERRTDQSRDCDELPPPSDTR